MTRGALKEFFGEICPSKTPGYSWSVSQEGRRLGRGWGGKAVVEPESLPVGEDTLFDLASLTKPLVTALLALKAWDNGELDLHAPVPGAEAPTFTMLQLLRHEAGFPAWLPLYALVGRREEVFPWLMKECPRVRPGSRAEYSCLGYVAAGLLLEQLLGSPMDRLFTERIALPLGLKPEEACFGPPEAWLPRIAGTERGGVHEAKMARQYGTILPAARDGLGGWGTVHDGNARFLGGVSGNAGLFGTLTAVEALSRAYRPDGGYLSARALELAWLPSGGVEGETRTAGWKSASSPGWTSGREIASGGIGHEGFTGTGVWLAPGGGRTYILLTNRIHPRHPETEFGSVRAAFLRAAAELN